jgi:hypothetical protein
MMTITQVCAVIRRTKNEPYKYLGIVEVVAGDGTRNDEIVYKGDSSDEAIGTAQRRADAIARDSSIQVKKKVCDITPTSE